MGHIHAWGDYHAQRGLCDQRPETLAQAARIPGVTPAATALLLVHIQKGKAYASAEVTQ